jgi:lysophospholipase L1-like esterase
VDAEPPRDRRSWRRYVAIGDSFTEGLADADPAAPGGYRGWADRLAEILDADARAAGGPGLEYANLAVRGRLLGRILDEQLPAALASGPDLVSVSGGGNDLLRPGADPDALAVALDEAVGTLRAAGADVLLTAGFDPRSLPVVRLTRGRVAAFNLHLWSIARRHGAAVLDLWAMRALYDPRMWAADRIHLSTEGHRRVALLAAATLRGATSSEQEEWAQPLPPAPPRSRLAAARDDAAWLREHLAPWVRRRLEHRSSGDSVVAKRPQPVPVTRGPGAGTAVEADARR